jgi:hypothetical protein
MKTKNRVTEINNEMLLSINGGDGKAQLIDAIAKSADLTKTNSQ